MSCVFVCAVCVLRVCVLNWEEFERLDILITASLSLSLSLRREPLSTVLLLGISGRMYMLQQL